VVAIFAAVMTGQGMGAIATIQVLGDSAEVVLRTVFRRKGNKPFEVVAGRVLLGDVVDDGEMIDEVTLGCEGPRTFTIHCHGNPLIVERIMELLRKQGVQAVPPEQLLARVFADTKDLDSISIEAMLALAAVKTTEGARIITGQLKAGLSEKIRQWRDRLDSTPLEEIAAEVEDILSHSEPARLMISGCTIALVGPPNTGKSTLLNTLAGREKAIVSDIRGTTRDWVSAEIRIPPLAATIIDTAGLDSVVSDFGGIDQAAQRKTVAMIEHADLVLLVLDLSQPAERFPESIVTQFVGKKVVTVLNKADLPRPVDLICPARYLGDTVQISAKLGTGIDNLVYAIHRVCGVAAFDVHAPVAFSDRQRRLLEALHRSNSKTNARSFLSELLESPVIPSVS
jgi:tRNA modification GTPase